MRAVATNQVAGAHALLTAAGAAEDALDVRIAGRERAELGAPFNGHAGRLQVVDQHLLRHRLREQENERVARIETFDIAHSSAGNRTGARVYIHSRARAALVHEAIGESDGIETLEGSCLNAERA